MTDSVNQLQSATAGNNRMLLLLIGGLPVTMILAATWLWIYVASGDIDLVDILGTSNRGTLLSPPLPLHELELHDRSQQPFRVGADGDARWRLLLPAPETCAEACAQALHYTRQIHTAMGKYKHRIERVFLGENHAQMVTLHAQLGRQYPELKFLYTPGAALSSLTGATQVTGTPVYYLVDPQGWVMMSYLRDADGKDVMADLKFLLKNSSG